MNTKKLKSELLRFTKKAYPKIKIDVKPYKKDLSKIAVYFTDPNFSNLYPIQRYHYLAQLIPQDFFEEYLLNTVWFGLAPGEEPEDLGYPTQALISKISPYVMDAIVRSGAVEALDDLFCPTDSGHSRATCYGDFRHFRKILISKGFKEEELFDIFHVLMAKGGYCDCEILYNTIESNRLKAEYWRARADNKTPYNPHQGGA